MAFSKSVAKIAFTGIKIRLNRELSVSGAEITQEHIDAIVRVTENYDEFSSLIMSELERWPLTERYFHKLIKGRLFQDSVLVSDFIACLLDETNLLEERLTRIQGKIENLEAITHNINVSRNKSDGFNTDEILLDIWNEILVMDFLLGREEFRFNNLEKVIREGRSHVDLLAQHNDKSYAIEITRIRKRDFQGITIPELFDDIYKPENIGSLHLALKRKLKYKNDQMEKFCTRETMTFDKKLIAIKTSQWEYQDGSKVVRDETLKLLDSVDYPYIDEVLLIYDVENYDWLK